MRKRLRTCEEIADDWGNRFMDAARDTDFEMELCEASCVVDRTVARAEKVMEKARLRDDA